MIPTIKNNGYQWKGSDLYFLKEDQKQYNKTIKTENQIFNYKKHFESIMDIGFSLKEISLITGVHMDELAMYEL